MDKPLVSICCITYNHEQYIRQCLDGFVMQETDFPFEIVIHDDASTDRTVEIIQEYIGRYPGLFVPIFQSENQYSKKIKPLLTYVFPKAKGEYLAICEGDDYWIDPLKLQSQVDFMKSNIEYGCVFTGFDQLIDKTGNVIKNYHKAFNIAIPTGDVFEHLLYNNPYVTCTSFFKKSLMDSFTYNFDLHNISPRDYSLWLHMGANSKIGYLPRSTATYRVLENSASHSSNLQKSIQFREDGYRISLFFAKYYNVTFDLERRRRSVLTSTIKEIVRSGKYKYLIGYLRQPIIIIKELFKWKIAKIYFKVRR